MKYTPTGSYVAVEVAELAIFSVGTLWMMWVIRSYKLKKPLDDEQERTVFKFIVIQIIQIENGNRFSFKKIISHLSPNAIKRKFART